MTVYEAIAELKRLQDKGLGNLTLRTLVNGDFSSFNSVDTIEVGKQVDEDYIVDMEEYTTTAEHELDAYKDCELTDVVLVY